MYLKALTLKGFKSFADKTDLQFEPGVTVVVGPNGSGKSNLVDAVAWVLGAQGARALRGAKMDDVIFAGTTKKPALGRAEVSLTIDNADGTLPIEFTEVTITRTLFRSGESEYRLNDVPCRLLDIQELLSDSRIGRTQHVIVGQGQLDSVLNARPEDRRAIIEEAAGVLKYRKRREKAQRRLEATEGNLTRLGDLVREVRRQLSPLERQADAARRHDGVRDELNAIRLFLAGQEIKGLQSTLERVGTQRLEAQEKEKVLLSELSDLDVHVLDAEAALMKVGDSDVAQWLTRAERLVSRTNATRAMLSERKRSIAAMLDSSADESVIESLLAEKEQLERSLEDISEKKTALEPEVGSLKEHLDHLDAQISELMLDAPRDDIERELGAAKKELNARQDALTTMQRQSESNTSRLDGVRHRISVLTQDHEDATAIVNTEAGRLVELTSQHDIVTTNLNGVREEIEQIEREYDAAQADAAKKKAHYDVLLDTFNSLSADSGIESVRNIDGVMGTLLENIMIEDVASEAASVVLSDLAQAIVVDSPESAKETMSILTSNDLGARLFVLGSTFSDRVTNIPEGCVPLSRYISSSQPRIEQALASALSNVVFVDGDWKAACDVALSRPDLVVVSRAGDRFGGNRAWSLGKQVSRAVTAENVETAGRDADNASRALSEWLARRNDVTTRKAELEERERELAEKVRETQSRGDIAQKTVETTHSALLARRNELESIETEQNNIALSMEQTVVDVHTLGERVVELESQHNNQAAFVAEFEHKSGTLNSERSQVRSMLRDKEIAAEKCNVLISDAQQRLVGVNERLAKDPEQERAARQRREQLLVHMRTIDDLLTRTESVESASIRARDVLSQEREKQTAKAHESTQALETLRVQRRDAEKNLLEARDVIQKSDITEAETKTRLSNTIELLRTNHDCEPDVALNAEMPEVGEATTLTQRGRELERELKMMGPINPLAVQEFDELNERHVFLTQQLDDVKASRKELHKVIKTIDQEIVTVFEKAFDDVQKHFSDLFQTLFSGGAGRLTLTDPNDMLNTGIEMEARPSGKNVRRLSLLSGGERSLTALAFLFAVFRSRPSPFYIMDEVEAALDEPNLMRFLDLVAEFRNDAQLLIVSHQKKTMEAADELYGVSMAPGGSSRALKQRVEKTQEPRVPVAALEKVDVDLVAEEAAEVEVSVAPSEQSEESDNISILESSI